MLSKRINVIINFKYLLMKT